MKTYFLKAILLPLIWLISCENPNAVFAQSDEQATKTLNILFLGNSYTFFNDLPDLIVKTGAALPEKIEIRAEQITPGGATLSGHFNNPATLKKISSGNWDYVVLQEQSMRPIDDPERMLSAIKDLDQVIHSSGAETILYMTWARKARPEMIEEIAESYQKAGKLIGAKVAPVGLGFEACRKAHPEIELYDPDGAHPSPEGSYLAASVIFSTITGQFASADSKGIEKEKQEAIRNIVRDIYHKSN